MNPNSFKLNKILKLSVNNYVLNTTNTRTNT